MVSVLQGLAAAVTDLRQAPLPTENISLQQPKGKNSSLMSLDLKTTLPVLTDKNLNLDSHLEDFFRLSFPHLGYGTAVVTHTPYTNNNGTIDLIESSKNAKQSNT
jgi:hypothetical protein